MKIYLNGNKLIYFAGHLWRPVELKLLALIVSLVLLAFALWIRSAL